MTYGSELGNMSWSSTQGNLHGWLEMVERQARGALLCSELVLLLTRSYRESL